MQMGFGLIQEQTQKLVMTTQMKQAIEVLQCSTFELQQYVEHHLSDNPFAEYEFPNALNFQPWSHRNTTSLPSHYRSYGTALPLDQTIRSELTLSEVLDHQLRFIKAPLRVIQAARFIVGCLNESGYVVEPDDELARILGLPLFVVNEAIDLIQACDPLGVGARNLKECLLLQLAQVPENQRGLVSLLIHHHLEEVASGKIPAMARMLKRSSGEIQDGVDALKRLNPRPGLAFRSGTPEYMIPDVIVEKNGNGYVILTNDGTEPKIQINNAYRKMLEHNTNEEATIYLHKKLQAAEWIVRCMEQRRITLYRVAEAIVEFQKSFFDNGRAYMKPLTLKNVAEALELHESTISRATRGKYMQTPRGIFEMRFFFTAELQSNDGTTSAEAVKFKIRECIEHEDSSAPLSDDAIAKQLAQMGIQISRRTVAKYREELDIPTSARRKRF